MVEIEVILVVGMVVPMSDGNLHREGVQVFVDIKNRLKGARKICRGGLVEDRNKLG